MKLRSCIDEIPPCSFETARRLLWRNINNELLPVYDRQLCECYLQPQILRCECLGDNKWFLISLKSEYVTQIWVCHSNLREAFPSNMSDKLRFESQRPSLKFGWNRLVSPRFVWTLKFERSPSTEGITLRSPRIESLHLFLRVVIYLMKGAVSEMMQLPTYHLFVTMPHSPRMAATSNSSTRVPPYNQYASNKINKVVVHSAQNFIRTTRTKRPTNSIVEKPVRFASSCTSFGFPMPVTPNFFRIRRNINVEATLQPDRKPPFWWRCFRKCVSQR